jgi:hypothetical protein
VLGKTGVQDGAIGKCIHVVLGYSMLHGHLIYHHVRRDAGVVHC